ncbi:MAG TPA: hypothetical protein P5234_01930 [Thermoanaerobaculaceae bacterium]|nr:hypothetical protein [Thermoanaerobaculaceae bacterium]HRS14987.1 hypothetical protein [Thermoanaerobaculaceae bacterium]
MKTEWIVAERAEAVRRAAEAWGEAGLVSAQDAQAIAIRYPDDRVRAATPMAVLSFVFAAVAGLAVLVLAAIVLESPAAGLLVVPPLAIAVERLVGAGRRVRTGVEGGLALALVVCVAVGAFWFVDEALGASADTAARSLLPVLAVACGLVCWRWGMATAAAPGACLAYLFLATFGSGRWLVLGTAVALTPVLSHGSSHARLTPSHRRALAIALAVSLAAAYLAVNLHSLDSHWIESLAWHARHKPEWSPVVRLACLAATALLPAAVLARGVRTRDRLLLWCGAVMLAASCVTVRAYVHVAPAWVLLVLAGLACLAAALLLQRWLERGRGAERGGFTPASLGEGGDPHRLAETAAVLATLTPGAPGRPPEGFRAGGGEFGGGGASGGF